ncbi:hypothetical protein [Acidocella sp.]|uniref:hypothetical protein n=1 Tax=Acidocella sp. TaxID=50710 RepID=UPI002F42AA95
MRPPEFRIVNLSGAVYPGTMIKREDRHLISNRNRKRHREDCKSSKSTTPSILRQQRSAERLRRFDRAMICGYGLLASILVLRLAFGGMTASPKEVQMSAQFHAAPLTSEPAKIFTASWARSGHAYVKGVSHV